MRHYQTGLSAARARPRLRSTLRVSTDPLVNRLPWVRADHTRIGWLEQVLWVQCGKSFLDRQHQADITYLPTKNSNPGKVITDVNQAIRAEIHARWSADCSIARADSSGNP